MIRVAIEVVRRKLERALKVKHQRLVEAKDDVTGLLVGGWWVGVQRLDWLSGTLFICTPD